MFGFLTKKEKYIFFKKTFAKKVKLLYNKCSRSFELLLVKNF